MAIKKFRPVTPSLRFRTVPVFDEEITASVPEKSLLRPLKKSGGRNNKGRITAYCRGGGHKRRYRLIDFKRNKFDVPARVASIEYDPNRSARIALLHYLDGEKRYIVAPANLKVDTMIVSGENVDNKKTLQSIISGLLHSKATFIFPIHPRTVSRLKEFGLYEKINNSNKIKLITSVGYFDILNLMKKCTFILTDSGGIQEEATSPLISKKVLIVRKSTDRQEAVDAGLAEVIGTNSAKISQIINKTLKNPSLISKKTPYGNGTSSKQILEILKKKFN